MTNLDSILKSRDITLPTKVRLVKAIVFPVVMYGCNIYMKVVLYIHIYIYIGSLMTNPVRAPPKSILFT